MLYTKDSFSFDSEIFDKFITQESFGGGVIGLNTEDIKQNQGLGAIALKKLAEVFKIPPDVNIILFMLTAYGEVLYIIPPAFKKKDNKVVFQLGDFFATVEDCFDAVEAYTKQETSSYGTLDIDILEVQKGTVTRKIPGFTFNLTPPGARGQKIEKMEYSFPVSCNWNIENSSEKLLKVFETAEDAEELLRILEDPQSDFVATIQNKVSGYSIPLKKLPLGIYYIYDIDRIDTQLSKKDGTPFNKVGWSFIAENVVTKVISKVEVSDSGFFREHLKNTGAITLNKTVIADINEKSPPLLKRAAIGKGGKGLMILSDMKILPQGISPQGTIFVRESDDLYLKDIEALVRIRLPIIMQRASELAEATETKLTAALPSAREEYPAAALPF